VHLAVQVGQAGAGGRLEIDLLAKGALIAKTRGAGSKQVVIGHVVRQPIAAGEQSLSVALTAQAKRALARHHKLVVTVRIVLTATSAPPASVTRSLVLRS
jgi:hypothetical protein